MRTHSVGFQLFTVFYFKIITPANLLIWSPEQVALINSHSPPQIQRNVPLLQRTDTTSTSLLSVLTPGRPTAPTCRAPACRAPACRAPAACAARRTAFTRSGSRWGGATRTGQQRRRRSCAAGWTETTSTWM